jgi:hypothetical protein
MSNGNSAFVVFMGVLVAKRRGFLVAFSVDFIGCHDPTYRRFFP